MCTIMVKDGTGHGVPVAFIISSSSCAEVFTNVFDKLRMHCIRGGRHIQPAYILVDDAAAEIKGIENCVWGRQGARVALCTWHVKRAWLQNLIHKVKDGVDSVAAKTRELLLRLLAKIVDAEVRMLTRWRVQWVPPH